jgi:hypothetical protein
MLNEYSSSVADFSEGDESVDFDGFGISEARYHRNGFEMSANWLDECKWKISCEQGAVRCTFE